MKILTDKQLERLQKQSYEQGLILGRKHGYQTGIIEGMHRALKIKNQINAEV